MLSDLVMQMYTNIKETTSESIEYPSYNVSYHPMPSKYEPREWCSLLDSLYDIRGYIVLHKLAAVEFEREWWDPYPVDNVIKQWGIEVIWKESNDNKESTSSS